MAQNQILFVLKENCSKDNEKNYNFELSILFFIPHYSRVCYVNFSKTSETDFISLCAIRSKIWKIRFPICTFQTQQNRMQLSLSVLKF